ncbi:MAG TPA: TIGR03905 family TSCPD domain-containing protein [Ruminococcaceae bacterium]|nr:TIGR03905 family TSCPD domain-containing protein [Oscillospiraceae bacterium]
MNFVYRTHGTCSRRILIDVDGDVIQSVKYEGGCAGNLAGISSLVAGMKVDDVIQKFSGIPCGFKSTSCPDQLAQALLAYKEGNIE